MTHECSQMEFIGKVKEFMDGMKGLKATLFTVSVAILIQVGTFIYLWGGLTTTVNTHEKNIEKILSKLDTIKIVYAEGAKGEKGDKGEPGKDR